MSKPSWCRNPLEAGLSFRPFKKLAGNTPQAVAIPSKRGCLSDVDMAKVTMPLLSGSQSPRSGAVFPTVLRLR